MPNIITNSRRIAMARRADMARRTEMALASTHGGVVCGLIPYSIALFDS